jgi:4-carboxymuconolactone decarboxylase
MMRLPLIAPADLTRQQKSLYDDMRKGIAGNFTAFKVLSDDGALMGPWNPWLHEPGIGQAIWDLTLAMTANASLPDNVRQVVILVVGDAERVQRAGSGAGIDRSRRRIAYTKTR